MENTNETIIEATNEAEAAQVVETTNEGEAEAAKKAKPVSVVYDDPKTIPANINATRAALLAFAQSQVCALKPEDVEAEKGNYRFAASMSTYGLGGRAVFWPTGQTLTKEGETINSLFEVVVAIRAIRPMGEKKPRGFSVKAKAEAEAVLFQEKYDAAIKKAVSEKKFKNADLARAKNPYVAWVKQQKTNMIEAATNTPEVNAANKARADKWAIMVEDKCKELQAASASDEATTLDGLDL